MTINEKLMRIQTQIKAPKNLYNSFGKYKYRNAEGICEAVKPYLEAEGVSLMVKDDVVEVGGKIYIKATAILTDIESGISVSTSAFARESAEKKGMDDSQITGTASSYARKYALNGLFLLDDTKDADSDEYKKENDEKAQMKKDEAEAEKLAKQKIDGVKVQALLKRCESENVDVNKILNLYKVESIPDLTERQYANINQNWQKIKGE
jgi:hypothetical protein